VKTFFLSNADLKETIDLLRVVLGRAARRRRCPGQRAHDQRRARQGRGRERIIEIVDKRRAEVDGRGRDPRGQPHRLKEYGIEITSGSELRASQGRRSGIPDTAPTPSTGTLPTLEPGRDQPARRDLPAAAVRLRHAAARQPAAAHRGGQTAQARFGDQVPVPVTTFAPHRHRRPPQQPITSFEYKNVGVNIDITPRVHHDGEVTLQLKLEISAVGAAVPEPAHVQQPLGHRTIRLRDGETNILAGLISDDERRRSPASRPRQPAVPRQAVRAQHDRSQETDIVMTLTPHVVRAPQITAEDLRSFQLGSETTPLLFEVPAIPPVAAGDPASDRRPAHRADPPADPDSDAHPHPALVNSLAARISRVLALLRDPRTPRLPKLLVLGACLYLLTPIDLVPEFFTESWATWTTRCSCGSLCARCSSRTRRPRHSPGG
jgi:general secretion pathway protein D